jgi:dihydroorotate dehydrogenase (NAD+) catalytic subunit
VDAWLDDIEPKLRSVGVDVWGSVVAHDVDGFATVASAMETASITAIEVNLSCPNLDGSPFALDPVLSAEVVQGVRAATSKPIGAKLSPDAMPISDVAAAVAEAGADWVVMGNTVMGAAIDPDTRRPLLSGVVGGYSGGPIRPIAVRCVLEISHSVPDLPIVGCGGVSSARHVIEYVLAGASAVAIGSAHFSSPRVAKRITHDLTRYLDENDLTSLSELRGAYEPWS